MSLQVIKIIELIQKICMMFFGIVSRSIKKVIRIDNWNLRNFNYIRPNRLQISILIFSQIIRKKYRRFQIINLTYLHQWNCSTTWTRLHNLFNILSIFRCSLDYSLQHILHCSVFTASKWIQILHFSLNRPIFTYI